MFTVMKVREGLGAKDYRDPGDYRNPDGTVAHEVQVAADQSVHRSDGRSTGPGLKAANDKAGPTTSHSHH
jgi:hypothetical protein